MGYKAVNGAIEIDLLFSVPILINTFSKVCVLYKDAHQAIQKYANLLRTHLFFQVIAHVQ